MPRNNLFTLFAKVAQLPEVFLGKTLVERFQGRWLCTVSVSHLALTRCGELLDTADSAQNVSDVTFKLGFSKGSSFFGHLSMPYFQKAGSQGLEVL